MQETTLDLGALIKELTARIAVWGLIWNPLAEDNRFATALKKALQRKNNGVELFLTHPSRNEDGLVLSRDVFAALPYIKKVGFVPSLLLLEPTERRLMLTPWGLINTTQAGLRIAAEINARGIGLFPESEFETLPKDLASHVITRFRLKRRPLEDGLILGSFLFEKDETPATVIDASYTLETSKDWKALRESQAWLEAWCEGKVFSWSGGGRDASDLSDCFEQSQLDQKSHKSVTKAGNHILIEPSRYERKVVERRFHGKPRDLLLKQRISGEYILAFPSVRRLLLSKAAQDSLQFSSDALAFIDGKKRSNYPELAPFRPLHVHQRLGFLEDEDKIRCIKTRKEYGIESGCSYPLKVELSPTKEEFTRTEVIGGREERIKLVRSGHGIAIKITTENRTLEYSEEKESLEELTRYFEVPDVPPVNEVMHKRYCGYLKILQTMKLIADQFVECSRCGSSIPNDATHLA